MKLFVISDTHGNFTLAMKAHSLSEQTDKIVHLGDGCSDADLMREILGTDVIGLAGNCDLGSSAPRELVWECEGKRILLTHGDAYGVKAGLEKLERRALEIRADLVLFGHSHLATQELHSGILFLNPGTMTNASPNKSYALVDVSAVGITSSLHNIS
ncbi:MAG: metallophosphoesterase [Desulfuromonadales bacterium]